MIDKVRILGVSESARMLLLKERVEEALRHLSLGTSIEEVTEIDQLMEYGIIGIPALVVGQRILFQQEVPEVDVLICTLAAFAEPSGKPQAGASLRKPAGGEDYLKFE